MNARLSEVDSYADSTCPVTLRSFDISIRTTSYANVWHMLDQQVIDAIDYRMVRGSIGSLDAVVVGVSRARIALGIVSSRVAFMGPDVAVGVVLTAAYRFCADVATELAAFDELGPFEAGESCWLARYLPVALHALDVLIERFDSLEGAVHQAHSREMRAVLSDLDGVRLALTRTVSALAVAA